MSQNANEYCRQAGSATPCKGEWDQVSDVIKKCHEAVHAMGAPRVSTSIRIGTRTDKEQSMLDKITVVEKILKEDSDSTSSSKP
ncbi:hypothetical protein HDU67_002703 [Dinochytrium kinnereticum]|nr:hypothetical protein HDU67_002703 [Dinochytrium kinnereticum]